jgi:hypothetical protein
VGGWAFLFGGAFDWVFECLQLMLGSVGGQVGGDDAGPAQGGCAEPSLLGAGGVGKMVRHALQ